MDKLIKPAESSFVMFRLPRNNLQTAKTLYLNARSHRTASISFHRKSPYQPKLRRHFSASFRIMSTRDPRDFEKVQASRADFKHDTQVTYTKSPNPAWKEGDGANDNGESLKRNHVEIDPYEEGRPSVSNYKLLISGMVPRPIALMSTRSKDGEASNLAPFSYSQVINHDPPLFVVGISGSLEKAKDTLRNLRESGEGVINIISEHFIEAANATSINTPYGVSEWDISGLHQAPCATVKASRVKESIVSIESKVVEIKEIGSRATPGKISGVMVILEGTRFWVRDDAVNEDRTIVDVRVLRPIGRFGGISYGRTSEMLEIPRPII